MSRYFGVSRQLVEFYPYAVSEGLSGACMGVQPIGGIMEKVNPLDLEQAVMKLGGIEAALDAARVAVDSPEGFDYVSLGKFLNLISGEVEQARDSVEQYMRTALKQARA